MKQTSIFKYFLYFLALIISIEHLQASSIDYKIMPAYTINFIWTGVNLRVKELHLHPARRSTDCSYQDAASHENLAWHLCEWAEIPGPLSINLWLSSTLLTDNKKKDLFTKVLNSIQEYIAGCRLELATHIKIFDIDRLPLTEFYNISPTLLKTIFRENRYFAIDLMRLVVTHAAATGFLHKYYNTQFGQYFVYSDLDIARAMHPSEIFDSKTMQDLQTWSIVMMNHEQPEDLAILSESCGCENGFQIITCADRSLAIGLTESCLTAVQRVLTRDEAQYRFIDPNFIWLCYTNLFDCLIELKHLPYNQRYPIKDMNSFIEQSNFASSPIKLHGD